MATNFVAREGGKSAFPAFVVRAGPLQWFGGSQKIYSYRDTR